jgi:DNA-binding NarL/FixJ family response regulator
MVLKTMAPELLMQCVRTVYDGGQWFERSTVSGVLATILRHETDRRTLVGLVPLRELEIVRLVARGLRNRGIADSLCITEGTVKLHLHHIYKKLLVDSRLTLTLYARDKGLV